MEDLTTLTHVALAILIVAVSVVVIAILFVTVANGLFLFIHCCNRFNGRFMKFIDERFKGE